MPLPGRINHFVTPVGTPPFKPVSRCFHAVFRLSKDGCSVYDRVSYLAHTVCGSDVWRTICDSKVPMEDRKIRTLGEAVRERANTPALIARAG